MSEAIVETVETTEEISPLPEEIAPLEPEKFMYKIRVGSDGYWTGACAIYGELLNSVEIEALPDETDRLRKVSYKLIDGALVFDEERYSTLLAEQAVVQNHANALAEIKSLEVEIKVLNDKLTECATYKTLGQEMPYAVADLLAEKAVGQQRINELEESL